MGSLAAETASVETAVSTRIISLHAPDGASYVDTSL